MNDNSCTRQFGFKLPRMPRVTCRLIVVLLLAASLSGIVQGCNPQGGTPQPGISLEALVDAFNSHDTVALDALIAADVLRHGPPGPPISSPGMPQGRDVVKMEWAAIWGAFPDAVMRIDTRIMDGDRLHAHYTLMGTHRGPFYGVMPTGAPAALRLSESYRIDEGKIVEIWTVTDTFSTIQSLTLPMPAPAPLAPRGPPPQPGCAGKPQLVVPAGTVTPPRASSSAPAFVGSQTWLPEVPEVAITYSGTITLDDMVGPVIRPMRGKPARSWSRSSADSP